MCCVRLTTAWAPRFGRFFRDSKYFDIKVENVRTELSEGVIQTQKRGAQRQAAINVTVLPSWCHADITVLVDSVTYTEQESVRTFYTFSAEVQWRTLLPVSGGVLNDTVDLRLQGPDLLSTFSPLYPGGGA